PWIFVFWLLRAFRVIDFALLSLYRLRVRETLSGLRVPRILLLFFILEIYLNLVEWIKRRRCGGKVQFIY
ncbi:MAG: hypothetical protein ACOC44_12430, partial [Promethearchaeia archaeon]